MIRMLSNTTSESGAAFSLIRFPLYCEIVDSSKMSVSRPPFSPQINGDCPPVYLHAENEVGVACPQFMVQRE